MRPPFVLVVLALLSAACRPGDGDAPGPSGSTTPRGTTAAAGSWSQAAGGPERTGVTSDPGPRALPGIAWTNPVAKEVLTEPVAASIGGTPVVLMGSGSDVVAFDLGSGKLAWSVTTPSSLNAAPAIIGDACWTLVMDGFVFAYSTKDGKLVKEIQHDFALEGSPLVVGKRLIYEEMSTSATVTESRLRALDTTTGTEAWAFDYPKGAGAPPSTDGKHVFVATHDGAHAVSLADGKPAWRVERPPCVHVSPPIVAGSRIVVARSSSFNGSLLALDAATGAVAWEKDGIPTPAADPAVTETEILVPLMDKKVHRYALADGAELGVLDPGGRSEVRPAVSPERIYVGVGQTVVAYDRKTLQEAWRLELESLEVSRAGIASLAVMGTKLVVVRLDGNLHALEAPGGA